MARRRGVGRGTRLQRGILSGATLAVMNSGVTLDHQGVHYSSGSFITPTEVGYLDGQAGYGVAYLNPGYQVTRGVADSVNNKSTGSASHQLTIATGLTTVYNFMATVYQDSVATSAVSYCQWSMPGSTSSVSCMLFASTGAHSSSNVASKGTSIYWLAFGE